MMLLLISWCKKKEENWADVQHLNSRYSSVFQLSWASFPFFSLEFVCERSCIRPPMRVFIVSWTCVSMAPSSGFRKLIQSFNRKRSGIICLHLLGCNFKYKCNLSFHPTSKYLHHSFSVPYKCWLRDILSGETKYCLLQVSVMLCLFFFFGGPCGECLICMLTHFPPMSAILLVLPVFNVSHEEVPTTELLFPLLTQKHVVKALEACTSPLCPSFAAPSLHDQVSHYFSFSWSDRAVLVLFPHRWCPYCILLLV